MYCFSYDSFIIFATILVELMPKDTLCSGGAAHQASPCKHNVLDGLNDAFMLYQEIRGYRNAPRVEIDSFKGQYKNIWRLNKMSAEMRWTYVRFDWIFDF